MSDILHILAPIITIVGSAISFAFALRAYRARARLIRIEKEKMAPSDSPIVEDEAVDPAFENDGAADQQDKGDA